MGSEEECLKRCKMRSDGKFDALVPRRTGMHDAWRTTHTRNRRNYFGTSSFYQSNILTCLAHSNSLMIALVSRPRTSPDYKAPSLPAIQSFPMSISSFLRISATINIFLTTTYKRNVIPALAATTLTANLRFLVVLRYL